MAWIRVTGNEPGSVLLINSSLAREIYASAGGAVIRFDRGPDRTLTAEQWAECESKLGSEQYLMAAALAGAAEPFLRSVGPR